MNEKKQSFLMAERLKALRESKGLSHVGLKNALFEKYGFEISRDSLMAYEVQDEYHKKAFANLGASVQIMSTLARFYGVSIDYLMGLSDYPTADVSAAAAAKYLGFKNLQAVEAIKAEADIIEKLVLSKNFSQFADTLNEYDSLLNQPLVNEVDSSSERIEFKDSGYTVTGLTRAKLFSIAKNEIVYALNKILEGFRKAV